MIACFNQSNLSLGKEMNKYKKKVLFVKDKIIELRDYFYTDEFKENFQKLKDLLGSYGIILYRVDLKKIILNL